MPSASRVWKFVQPDVADPGLEAGPVGERVDEVEDGRQRRRTPPAPRTPAPGRPAGGRRGRGACRAGATGGRHRRRPRSSTSTAIAPPPDGRSPSRRRRIGIRRPGQKPGAPCGLGELGELRPGSLRRPAAGVIVPWIMSARLMYRSGLATASACIEPTDVGSAACTSSSACRHAVRVGHAGLQRDRLRGRRRTPGSPWPSQ